MNKIRVIIRLLLSCAVLYLAGCACVDPIEPLNRKIFAFNMALDKGLFRPISSAYDTVVPSYVQCRIGNFFDNLDDLTNIANNTLQCKFLDAWSDCWRFAFNTTFGFFGLYDVASCAGLPKHHQDFGLTLARYGFVNSPYLMIPFFGPSTIRDTVGWTIDWRYLSIWPYIEPPSLRYGLYGLRLVHKRACLLAADKLIDDSLDPYIFVRDAYLQKRECDIKSICPPPCDAADAGKAPTTEDKDDTFVGDENDKGNAGQDSDDTFVADDEDNSANSADKAPSSAMGSKPTPAGDDTFVAP